MRSAMLVIGTLTALALAGCTGEPPAHTPRPTVTETLTATASSSPTPTMTTTVAPTPTATTGAGCRNDDAVPAGADTARIGDIDGDGRADTEFYAERPKFEYGFATAAGGVFVLPDDLAGPATHTGWSTVLASSRITIAVLDDDRTATLHAFVGCRFVTPHGVDGQPYRFGLAGFYSDGTGVECDPGSAGSTLEGLLAKRRSDGRYDLRFTRIDLTADGTEARNGPTATRYADLPRSDPRVRAAMISSCGAAPKVHTSGE